MEEKSGTTKAVAVGGQTPAKWEGEAWEHLVGDCRAIIVERGINARMEVIRGKWEVGKRIAEDAGYKKFGKGSGKFVQSLADAVGCSESNVYMCVQFYEKFPAGGDAGRLFDELPDGKDVSWHKIAQKYLGKGIGDGGEASPRLVYRVEEVRAAFIGWFNSSRATQAEEAMEEFMGFLNKKK